MKNNINKYLKNILDPYCAPRPKARIRRRILRAAQRFAFTITLEPSMKNNINKYLKKCLIYPYNFLKFIRKINVKYLMNNNKNSIIDNNIIYQMLHQR